MRRTSPRRIGSHARRAATALVVALLSVSLVAPAAHADRDELVRQQQENERRQAELESSLEGVDADLARTYLRLEEARARLPEAEAELAEAEQVLAAAQRRQEQIAGRLERAEAEAIDLEEEIAEGTERIEQTHSAMGQLARSVYRGDHTTTTLEVLLDASSSEDFLRGYSVTSSAVDSQTQVLRDLEEATAITRNQQERHAAVQERIEELKDEADAAVVEANQARDDAVERKAEIEQLQADMEELSEELEGQQQQYQSQLADAEDEQRSIANEIARIDEENRRRAAEERRRQQEAAQRAGQQRSSGGGGSSSSSGGGSSVPSSSSHIAPPIPGPLTVTSPYGYRVYPITGGWFMHNGVDLRSACGNPQYAGADGVVERVNPTGSTPTSGNQVIINHGTIGGNSYVTITNHLSGFAVRPGQRVSQGDLVGYTGATGMVTGCHVHFEVWRNGSTIDPMNLWR